MIVETGELGRLAGRVTMVDGGFDPFHDGHVAYFAAAAELGEPLLCNVAPDSWVARKHPVLLTQERRAAVVDAVRHIAYTHLAESSTADVLRLLRPRFYVKGADWRGRLPAEEVEACREHGVEVAYVDTMTGSSTELVRRLLASAAGATV